MAEPKPAEGGGVPVHFPTILLGLWRRRALPIVLTAAAAVVGVVVALGFGERQYAAETVLMYSPTVASGDTAASPQTILNLVKVQSNLEETRRRLKKPVSIPALAASFSAAAQKGTDLLSIRAVAPTAKEAAERANTLREVFLENQARLQQDKAGKQVKLVQRHLDELNAALAAADSRLIDLGNKNGIVDLEKQTGSYLQNEMSVGLLYQQALGERTAVEQQNLSLDQSAADLKKKIAQEQKAGPQEDLGSLNIRIGRLRSSIDEDRKTRAAQAQLAEKQAELRRAEALAKEGLLAQAQLDRIRAEYEAQNAITTDTDQIQQWKNDLKRLDTGVVPTKSGDTPSANILREVMLRRLDLDLQKVAVAERVKQLDSARSEAKERVAGLPELRRQVNNLKREVEGLELEKRSLEDLLAKAKAAAGSSEADFTVVSAAVPPVFPIQSSRYPLLIAMIALGAIVGLGLAAADEARDLSVRSGAEVPLKLAGARTLAVIPKLPPHLARLPDGSESPLFEPFRRLTRQLRRALPERGVRIMVVSATPGEGTTLVAAYLAATFGRQDERVLLLDASLPRQRRPSLREHALADDPLDGGFVLPADVEARIAAGARSQGARGLVALRGLAGRARPHLSERLHARLEALAERAAAASARGVTSARLAFAFLRRLLPTIGGAAAPALTLASLAPVEAGGLASVLSFRSEALADVTHPTRLLGVACVPGVGEAALPDVVASRRMGELLDDASSLHSVVIVDAPAALDSADAEILAPDMDAVVFVVRSQGPSASKVKHALARISGTGVPVAGVVLNGVDKLYLSCSGEAVL